LIFGFDVRMNSLHRITVFNLIWYYTLPVFNNCTVQLLEIFWFRCVISFALFVLISFCLFYVVTCDRWFFYRK
jgi:hypothetical protein